MSKSKKHKTPRIDPAILARPRLDALLERYERGEDDLAAGEANVRALAAELGEGPVVNALVKRLEGVTEDEREMLMLLVPRLKSRSVIDYLWQQVKQRGGLSLDAKMTALVILKGMDEEVDLTEPGLYFSGQDIKATDIKTAEDLLRTGMRGLARGLRAARDAAEVEAYMHKIQQVPESSTDLKGVLPHLIETAEAEGTDLSADFLYALAYTTPRPEVRQAVERALAKMEVQGVKPVTRAVLDLGREKFYAAYMTDPHHPWQQNVVVGWERAAGTIQSLSFLLDFGIPWRGAIKDMFVTRGMSPREFERRFKEKAEQKMDERIYRVPLARAKATVAAAVQANREFKIPFPKEFNEARHLVERWVLNPPAAALAADTTRDELGNLPLAIEHPEQPLVLNEHDLKDPAVQQWLAQNATAESEEPVAPEEEDAEEQDLLREAHYSPPVGQLLRLGEPKGTKWRNYLMDGIDGSHIPELISMATDRGLNRSPGTSKIVWAPVHAWRALGELRASEAVEPLTGLLQYIDQEGDTWIGEDLPEVFGRIGPAGLEVLDAYLSNGRNPLWARVAATGGIERVGKNYPEARDQCVAILTHALEDFRKKDPKLNADIVVGLVELHAVESASLIERAFVERRVDESVMGDWEDVQVELGFKTAREKPKRGGWLDTFKF
jgi:hypothetical protein